MLVYTLCGRPAAPPVARASLTPAMEEQIAESDWKLQQRIQEFAERKERLVRLIEGRKQKAENVWEFIRPERIEVSALAAQVRARIFAEKRFFLGRHTDGSVFVLLCMSPVINRRKISTRPASVPILQRSRRTGARHSKPIRKPR